MNIRLPGYDIIKKINEGGMSDIYIANQVSLNRLVVLKKLKEDQNISRIKQEGEILAKLNHPNIVNIYDLVEEKNTCFIIEEYIEGFPLNLIISKDSFDDEFIEKKTFVSIVKQIISGLNFAHKNGIIHRDLKPHNILINKDSLVKICDFGISSKLDVLKTKSIHSLCGTIEYMPPELFDDSPQISKSVDYYSLGCIVYELITLKRPFRLSENQSLISIIKQKVSGIHSIKILPGWALEYEPLVIDLLSDDSERRVKGFLELSHLLTKENIDIDNLIDTSNSQNRDTEIMEFHVNEETETETFIYPERKEINIQNNITDNNQIIEKNEMPMKETIEKKDDQTVTDILLTTKIQNIPSELVANGIKWTPGMRGAIKMMRKRIKKLLRKESGNQEDILYKEGTLLIVNQWNDGTWFDMWARSQIIGVENLKNWVKQEIPAESYSEQKIYAIAFTFCVYLELKRWRVV
ncbi:MAG: protein kinase [Candidatus Lokiarchaeota archaeon]|nr:protein kinase [Candidatus Lokiarchaeota archaeon]